MAVGAAGHMGAAFRQTVIVELGLSDGREAVLAHLPRMEDWLVTASQARSRPANILLPAVLLIFYNLKIPNFYLFNKLNNQFYSNYKVNN